VEKADRITIRHHLRRIVAFIEIVSPGNKDGDRALERFVANIADALQQGIHVLVLDLFPPTLRDPAAIHKAIWDQFDREDFDLPSNPNRVFASYESAGVQNAHIGTIGLGELLPDMPVFIAPGVHVLVPVEETYMNASSVGDCGRGQNQSRQVLQLDEFRHASIRHANQATGRAVRSGGGIG
jgi:hypothetical protein